MRTLHLVALAAWRDSLEQWSWRSFMVTLMLNQVAGPIIGLLVWTAVDPGSAEIRTYFLVLLAVQLLTVSYEDHTLCASIFDGTISNRLLMPQPVIVGFIGSNLALRFWHSLFGLPVVLVVGVLADVNLHLGPVAVAVPAVLLAGALRFVFTSTLAMTSFWTERGAALVSLGNTVIVLLGGIAAPLFLLPTGIGAIGRLLPFWPMLGMPAEIAAGALTPADLALAYTAQLAWLILAVAGAVVVWRRGLRVFTAVGG